MRFRAILGAFLLAAGMVSAPGVRAEETKGTVTGRVVDARGKAIAGARVNASGAADAEATTDEHGDFRLELVPGEYRFQFEADGHASAALREPVTVAAGKETKLRKRVELPEADQGSVVRGSVFDLAGRSIAGAKVRIERVREDDGAPVKMEVTSDSMGLFAFRLPKGGGRYLLTASHAKFATATVTVDVSGGDIVNAPPLKMSPGKE